MREIDITLGGETVTLAATFGAAQEVAKKVADPLHIAREANLEAVMISRGLPYQPRFTLTVENVPLLLHIGMSHAGDKRKLPDVQEMVFDAGFIQAKDAAIEYIALIVLPKSEEIKGEKSSGE